MLDAEEGSGRPGDLLQRSGSQADMMARLEHDSQPENMLRRLSADSAIRRSLQVRC